MDRGLKCASSLISARVAVHRCGTKLSLLGRAIISFLAFTTLLASNACLLADSPYGGKRGVMLVRKLLESTDPNGPLEPCVPNRALQ